MNTLVLVGSCVAAVVSIITACVMVIRVCIKVNKWRETQERHTKENYLDIKRLTITSPYMPLSERLAAGEAYVKEGGNGEVKQLYHKLLKKLDNKGE